MKKNRYIKEIFEEFDEEILDNNPDLYTSVYSELSRKPKSYKKSGKQVLSKKKKRDARSRDERE